MTARANMRQVVRILHVVALWTLGLAAMAMLAFTIGSAMGLWPWMTVQAGLGEPSPIAGVVAQIGITALLVLVAAFFPSSMRVLQLENSHRSFHIGMRDVAEAYHAAHVGDRKGVFTLSSEFDQVRERIDYLRQHPDLKLLEADILTLAAQMSQQSHRLAEIYNEERVSRARDFLAQRQQEAEEQQKRITEALGVCREIMRWNGQVEVEESVVQSQLQQLDEQLQQVLPALGYHFDGTRAGDEAAAVADEGETPLLAQDGPSVQRPEGLEVPEQRLAAE